MNEASVECAKCRGRMEDGFIVDVSYAHTAQSQWIEGPPEKSFWTGLSIGDKRTLKVMTYRCTNCGYLESYAN